MKKITLGGSGLEVPVVAVGCMRLNKLSPAEAERLIGSALEMGANFFDHADIYGGGECEEIFGGAVKLRGDAREKIILQSKCGISRSVAGGGAQTIFDFSKEHILAAVEGILSRLRTDYLDVLLLHRPDALVEPEEVAEAFSLLHRAGKVRQFGVSNQNPAQIRLLQKYVAQPIVANQLQLSVTNAGMISAGLHVNMEVPAGIDRDGGVLDFCRLHDITVQPWSPFQYGFFEGVFLDSPKYHELNQVIREIAAQYGVSNTTIAMAWLLRHPAKMQPVTGTTNVGRLRDCVKATEIELTRAQWYEIYLAAGNVLP